MKEILNFLIHQLLILKIGGAILLMYYKFKGRKITYSQILNEINPKTGIKKYAYKAFYLGVGFLIILVLIISTLMGLNPKVYIPKN
jgi:hypothetical protein